MVDVKEAVKNASAFIGELYAGKSLADLDLEEVERSEDDKYWFITLGYLRPQQTTSALQMAITRPWERVYKVVKIDAESGKPLSMLIRKL